MICTFCKKKQADFYTKGANPIRFACSGCVWTAEIRKQQLNYELVSLPTEENKKNGRPASPRR